MKKTLIVIIILFCMVYIQRGTGFTLENIRLTNGEWPPYLSEDLKYYGISSRIVTEAFARVGVKVEYGFFPWKRAFKYAKTGEWDGSVIWQRTPEREKYFYFSDVILEGTYVFFHLKSVNFDWNTIEDLKGIKIGATGGYTYGEAFDKAAKENSIQVDYVIYDVQNLKKMLAGRIKIFPVELNVGLDLLQKHFSPEQINKITFHPKIIKRNFYRLILSKKIKTNRKRIALFNKGLSRLCNNGKVKQYMLEFEKGLYNK